MSRPAVHVGGGWTLLVLLLVLAGQLWPAFRGTVAFDLLTLAWGPALTTIWYAVPLLVVTGSAGLLTDRFAEGKVWWLVLIELLVVGVILRWALSRQAEEHRG